jgi:hypothetical protein
MALSRRNLLHAAGLLSGGLALEALAAPAARAAEASRDSIAFHPCRSRGVLTPELPLQDRLPILRGTPSRNCCGATALQPGLAGRRAQRPIRWSGPS